MSYRPLGVPWRNLGPLRQLARAVGGNRDLQAQTIIKDGRGGPGRRTLIGHRPARGPAETPRVEQTPDRRPIQDR